MVEAAQQEFTKKIEGFQERVQVALLPVEKKVANCVAGCFNKYDTDFKSAHKCVEQCQSSVQIAQKKVENEQKELQNSIQSCHNALQSRLQIQARGAQGNKEQEAAVQKEFESGLLQCFRQTEPMIPQIEKNILNVLREHS